MADKFIPWKGYRQPFKIFGNLFFVGTEPASVHIVDSGDGLIMFDTGYLESLYLVIDNMHRLGLDPKDVKYIFLTHGHIDHFGGAAAIRELAECKIALGKEDREYANGSLDLSYAKELGMEFNETFEPDILLSDGDEIKIGNTLVRAVATPGHTPGTMSFIFNVTDGIDTYFAGLHGGMGTNTMRKSFLDKYGLDYSCRQKFKIAMDNLKKEHVDIFLGNHALHNNTFGKYEKILAGDKKAFVNPEEWAEYAEWAKRNLENLELKEKQQL